ncbi:septum formation initiator family protein [Candidatus Kaiserbacteria bacterium]|nr:septum formation initiator family protein [Candidatus Kaiserbacteria bacterium]
MFDFHQKRKIREVINSPFTQGLILVLVLVVGWSAYIRFETAMEMRERREKAEEEVVMLQDRKDSLEEQVQYLSDDRGIEAEMRRQFDVALEGEKVVVILDEKKENVEPLATSTVETEKKWYQFWR